MTIINLNRYYYPQCHRNALIEVPDEVAEILERGQRAEHNQESKKTYHKVYSLDQSPALENHAAHFALSPEEVLLRDMDAAADALLLARLDEAISRLSPTQARRLHARYVLKKKFREIAADEGISGSCAATSVTGAVKNCKSFSSKMAGCQRRLDTKMDKSLEAQKAHAEKEIFQLENRQKILLNRIRKEERNARTSRLCRHGAILEGVFPFTASMDGELLKAFLIALSRLPGARELTEKAQNTGDGE